MSTPATINPGERWVSVRRVWRALTFGIIGWLPWVFGVLSSHPAWMPGSLALPAIMLLLFAWSFVFCGIGSVICWRRESYAVAAARLPWRFALALNYGYFPAWLCLIAAAFLFAR